MLISSGRKLVIHSTYNRCCLKMLNILILGIKKYFSNEPPNRLHSQEKLAGILMPPILLRTFCNQLMDSCVKENCLLLAVTDLQDFSKTHHCVAFLW